MKRVKLIKKASLIQWSLGRDDEESETHENASLIQWSLGRADEKSESHTHFTSVETMKRVTFTHFARVEMMKRVKSESRTHFARAVSYTHLTLPTRKNV